MTCYVAHVTGAAAVKLEAVEKRFGQVQAVVGVDLEIAEGEIVAFLGPNGAGKTTTIDMIFGLSEPSVGAVRVFGLEPRQAVLQGLVAAVMQSGGLLRDLTVAETVESAAWSVSSAARSSDSRAA